MKKLSLVIISLLSFAVAHAQLPYLVKDVNNVPLDATPDYQFKIGSDWIFFMYSGLGYEPYKTNLNPGNLSLIKDIYPGTLRFCRLSTYRECQ